LTPNEKSDQNLILDKVARFPFPRGWVFKSGEQHHCEQRISQIAALRAGVGSWPVPSGLLFRLLGVAASMFTAPTKRPGLKPSEFVALWR
jgi:hypothetical protein